MEFIYACTKCNPPLQPVEGTRREMEKHLAEHHFNFRPQRCRGCGFHCFDEEEMVAHRDSTGHSVTLGEVDWGEKHIEWGLKLALAECLQTQLPQQRPALNNAPAVPNDGRLVECRECEDRVSTAQLESHIAERHFDYRPHCCHTCGFHCYGEAQMVAHRVQSHRGHKITLGQLTGEEHSEAEVRLAMEHTLRGPEAVQNMADPPAAAPDLALFPAAPNQARRRQPIHGQVECLECGKRVPHTDRSMCAHVNWHLELTLRQCGLCHRRFTAYPQGVIRRHINTHPRQVADGAADENIIVFHDHIERVQGEVEQFFGV